MKWYKHISDSLDDPFIFGLIKDFGGDGYLTFFGVLEIYSREFRTEPGWKLIVTESYLKQKLYKRQGTVIIKCLKYIATNGKLPATVTAINLSPLRNGVNLPIVTGKQIGRAHV